jgi:ABC-type protease/lipase transport system fused ATPase/permease subunit
MTNEETVNRKLDLAYIGFYLSIVSLFISFHGLISLLSIIICFASLVKLGTRGTNSKIAFIGLILSLISLIYAYAMLLI